MKTNIEALADILQRMARMRKGYPDSYRNRVGYITDRDKMEVAVRKLLTEDFGYTRDGEVAGDYRDAGREPWKPRYYEQDLRGVLGEALGHG